MTRPLGFNIPLYGVRLGSPQSRLILQFPIEVVFPDSGFHVTQSYSFWNVSPEQPRWTLRGRRGSYKCKMHMYAKKYSILAPATDSRAVPRSWDRLQATASASHITVTVTNFYRSLSIPGEGPDCNHVEESYNKPIRYSCL